MANQPTADDARQSLTAHVAGKAADLRCKYGPIGWKELQQVLSDRQFVRYPCEIVFDARPLQPGEFAFSQPNGECPEDGFTIFVHPFFAIELGRVPGLVLYHLVAVNYGPFASAQDAETFGAVALGLDQEAYYQALCAASDELAGLP